MHDVAPIVADIEAGGVRLALLSVGRPAHGALANEPALTGPRRSKSNNKSLMRYDTGPRPGLAACLQSPETDQL